MELSCNGTKECEIWMLINLDAFENVADFSSLFVVVVVVMIVCWSFFASTKGHFTMGEKSIPNSVAKPLQVTASSVICSISWHSCR